MKSYKILIGILLALVTLPFCGKNEGIIEKPPHIDPSAKKKIILMIGDGMGLSQITAASVHLGRPLNLEQCKYIGLQKVFASDQLVPSSASSITAIASGVKTKYDYVGLDADGKKAVNIAEMLSNKGFATGIVTTSFVSDNTPAGFYGHNPDRYDREGIALDLLTSGLDVVIGGGRDHFNQRSDGLNLLDSLQSADFLVFDNLQAATVVEKGKVACFTDTFRPPKISEGRGDMLSDATLLALRLLDDNENGFFLMVEGGQIDWACHFNDQEWLMDEMLDFDKVVGEVLDYAAKDGNTLVIITGDHETGGFALTGGNESSGEVQTGFVIDDHTATMVPVFAFGPGAGNYTGVYKNTAFFEKFREFFGI
ncbi:MAG: alkaline phosphatase [Bacteroidales bacterium]|nr:alkaline phosphatase [Bacteroidales bacterium]